MRAEEFDYLLPKKLIAQEPVEPRDSSRLLVLDRKRKMVKHGIFKDLPSYLNPGDLLVANNTRVFPARLQGYKVKTQGKVEVLLLRPLEEKKWEVLIKPGRKVSSGTKVIFGSDSTTPRREGDLPSKQNSLLAGFAEKRLEEGKWVFSFQSQEDIEKILKKMGEIPLPPYIHKSLSDEERYQTVYAKRIGSVAAPTAGLHFTSSLIKKLKQRGTGLTFITLNIGLDTFRPLSDGELANHRIHGEFFKITDSSAKIINRTLEEGGRVIAVGTSTARVLETAATKSSQGSRVKSQESEVESQESRVGSRESKKLSNFGTRKPKFGVWDSGLGMKEWRVFPEEGRTDLFICPGYKFKIVDALITNFHLPKSTTLVMVSAFGGKDLVMAAYEEAMDKNYRFFTFGDAMLIL